MEVVSREMMKPSSPTPQHLRKHKLSFLDQQAPPTYFSLLFFFESPSSNQSIDLSRNLKQSLSRVLTKFYPLAGRIVNDDGQGNYVDCNDEGVEYVETRVHARMSDVIVDPDPVDLRKYVWTHHHAYGQEKKITNPISIHVSTFDCGGVAVGACMAHKIGDMASFVMFMNDWSNACRNELEVSSVDVDFHILPSRFPPRPASEGSSLRRAPVEGRGVFASKRFVFEKGVLTELKRVGSSLRVENPSRVEAVTAFLWGSYALARRGEKREFVALHAVNARDEGFGNGCRPAVARWSSGDGDDVIPAMAAEIRDAIRRARIEGAETSVDGGVEFDCVFSSWCRFPMYSVDFGWGRPVWVGTAGEPSRNVTFLMDTKNGDGVEAWVNMVEADMAVVEENYRRLHHKVMMQLV